jgi:D-alanyl-D-alanine carboxypeptidase
MRLLFILAFWLVVLNATRADARTVTGYSHGRKTRIQLVTVSGVELEAATARAFKVMAKAARKAGIEIAIRSGFRSHEKQKQLYREYKRGWGHLAAKPGYSNHQSGKALDIYIRDYKVYEWLKKNASKFGFKRTVKREAWHWEYTGSTPRRREARHQTSRSGSRPRK